MLSHIRRAASVFVFAGAIVAASTTSLWAKPPVTVHTAPPAAQPHDAKSDAAPAPWLRVTESDGGNTIKLEVVSRRYEPADGKSGPAVTLVGAVHIADKSFYESLQTLLDEKDVVLFEGVKPPGAGRLSHEVGEVTDQTRAKISERRVRFVASAVAMHFGREGQYPATLADLVAAAPDRLKAFVEGSLHDAWDHEVVYQLSEDKKSYDVVSLGADGKEGGEGAAADLFFSKQKPLTEAEGKTRGTGKGKQSNIQTDLAKALGVSFQLDAMKHDGKGWRNSDLSMDQVQDRLAASGADASSLFKMLDGSGFMAQMLSGILHIVANNPMWSTTLKAVMVDVLGQADSLMDTMPGGLGKTMAVIVDDRNKVVMDDLSGVLKSEPDVKEIGVIYGAGHMPGLEKRLKDLGYGLAADGEVWRTAMSVNLKVPGVDAEAIKSMRQTMRTMIEQQMKMKH